MWQYNIIDIEVIIHHREVTWQILVALCQIANQIGSNFWVAIMQLIVQDSNILYLRCLKIWLFRHSLIQF